LNLKNILLQGLGYTSANLVGVVITFLVTVYITRLIGPEARGVYAWATGILAIAVQAGLFGIDTIFRFRAAREEDMGALFNQGTTVALLVGGGLAGCMMLAVPFFPYSTEAKGALVLAILPLPLCLGLSMFGAIFQGSRNIQALVATTIGQKIALAVALLVLTLTPWLGVWGIMVATALGVCVAFAQNMMYAVRQGGAFWKRRPRMDAVVAAWKLGMSSYAADVMTALLIRIPLLVSFGSFGAGVTGHLSIAVVLVDLMLMVPSALALVLAPHTVGSNLSAKQTNAQIWRFHILTMLALVVVAAVAWVCAPFAIVLVYGDAFQPSVEMFRLLLGYFLAMGSFRLSQQVLVNHVRPRWLALPPGLGGAVFAVAMGVGGVQSVEGLIGAITAAALIMAWSAGAIFAMHGVTVSPNLYKEKS
jgi:O-antigen/teichoic acid export membrane protein